MAKLSINLLPPELGVSERKKAGKKKLTAFSIIFLVITIIVSSAILGFEIYQKIKLQDMDKGLEKVKTEVTSFHEEEVLNFLLKERLKSISSVLIKESIQSQSFILISGLMPPDTRLLNFTADKSGLITLTGDAENSLTLEKFFDDLMDPSVNEGKIVSAKIDNLSRAPSGLIRFDLSIKFQTSEKKT